MEMERRESIGVEVGGVVIGGGGPVVVQSMTNTDTADIEETTRQIAQLAQAGSELVRITIDREEAAKAVPHIRERLAGMNISVPLVGDFHYIGHKLLRDHPETAEALDKYRINPGNAGSSSSREGHFAKIIEIAIRYGKAVRIGVNWGSLDQNLLGRMMDENAALPSPRDSEEVMLEALARSALESAELARKLGLGEDRIILSAKVSKVREMVMVNRLLARSCSYPLHLGLTEAGMGMKGIVGSSAALAILLHEGIGDTIRVSLTPRPGQPRSREVEVAREILQSLDLGHFRPQITACPGCGRTTSDYFQELAREIEDFTREKMPQWRKQYPGAESLSVAVMGCIVNGPGESRHADIGISLPGAGEEPACPVFIEGKKAATLRGDDIAARFRQMIEDYVRARFG